MVDVTRNVLHIWRPVAVRAALQATAVLHEVIKASLVLKPVRRGAARNLSSDVGAG